MACATKDALELIESEFVPQLRQRPDVTECTSGFKDDDGRCRVGDRLAGGPCQTGNHLIELAVELIKPAQRGNGALLGLAVLITVSLNELQVAAGGGRSDFDKHAITIQLKIWSSTIAVIQS